MGGDERSTLLQPRGACVCVEDLGYARAAKGQLSLELSNVNFVAQPGEVWFAMGRSGPWMRVSPSSRLFFWRRGAFS